MRATLLMTGLLLAFAPQAPAFAPHVPAVQNFTPIPVAHGCRRHDECVDRCMSAGGKDCTSRDKCGSRCY